MSTRSGTSAPPDSGPKSLDSSPDSRDDPLDSSAKSLESGMLKTELQRARTRSSELARPDSSELRPGLQRPTPGTSSRTPPWREGRTPADQRWSPALECDDYRPNSRAGLQLSGLILPSGLTPRPFLQRATCQVRQESINRIRKHARIKKQNGPSTPTHASTTPQRPPTGERTHAHTSVVGHRE